MQRKVPAEDDATTEAGESTSTEKKKKRKSAEAAEATEAAVPDADATSLVRAPMAASGVLARLRSSVRLASHSRPGA